MNFLRQHSLKHVRMRSLAVNGMRDITQKAAGFPHSNVQSLPEKDNHISGYFGKRLLVERFSGRVCVHGLCVLTEKEFLLLLERKHLESDIRLWVFQQHRPSHSISALYYNCHKNPSHTDVRKHECFGRDGNSHSALFYRDISDSVHG